MDENLKRPKWRFSLSAALAAVFAISVGMGLMRLGPRTFLFGAAFIFCAIGAFIAHGLGRDPTDGVLWGLLVLAILAFMLQPAVQYLQPMDENPSDRPKRRRWRQFSLRTLFSLFLLGAGFGLGWTARIAYERWVMQVWVERVLRSGRSAPYDAGGDATADDVGEDVDAP